MARQVPESTKKQVKEAVAKEADKKIAPQIVAVEEKKQRAPAAASQSAAIPARLPPPSERYLQDSAPQKKEEPNKEAKKGIETLFDDTTPARAPEGGKAIDSLVSQDAPPQKPELPENAPQDIAGIYRQNAKSQNDTDPSLRYHRAAGLPGMDAGADPAEMDRRRAEEYHLMKESREKVYQRNTDSQGQSDVFGTDEHSISGRLKKLYSRG